MVPKSELPQRQIITRPRVCTYLSTTYTYPFLIASPVTETTNTNRDEALKVYTVAALTSRVKGR
jgi:hypothetical protein